MKAHSKSELKRLYAMGIEDLDVHLDWCAIEEMGACSCGLEDNYRTPASEASGPTREAYAQQHIEALKLLEQACIKMRHARRLLGDKKA